MNKIVILALICALAVSQYTEVESLQMFEDFKTTFGRNYESVQEETYRYAVFKDMLEIIRMRNEMDSATHGVNQFSDFPYPEWKAKFLGLDTSLAMDQEIPEYQPEELEAPAPQTWNWATNGAVTGVKNQGQCGSCWAFSTTGNLEGQQFITNKNLLSLSEQELVSCDTTCNGCGGGLMTLAFAWIQSNGGITLESTYPYVSGGGNVPACSFQPSSAQVWVTGYQQITTGEAAMVQATFNLGPLSIGINANPLQTYTSGTLVVNSITCPPNLDHGVLITGFNLTANPQYWIIKNSWGTSWGMQGYFQIIYGRNACGLANMVSSASVKSA